MNIRQVSAMVAALAAVCSLGAAERRIAMLPGESWWGCANYFGKEMPFTSETKLDIDLTEDGYANQYASFLVSDKGRAIWCNELAKFEIGEGVIAVTPMLDVPVELVETGGTLRDAFRHASKTWFPPSGKMPDPLFFSAPQYNTWCELIHFHSEKGILDYAKAMLDNGLPPGVLMIDNSWQTAFGTWRFEASRFSDPKGMVRKLHAMGFKVILWMVPFVSMDTMEYRLFERGLAVDDSAEPQPVGGLLGMPGNKDDPAAVKWWCGKSALLDLTHPRAREWFKGVCDGLMRDYEVDGFKFDGGHLIFYNKGYETYRPATPGEQVMEYAKFNLLYPLCEYRNAWKFQGQPVVERLHDKHHTWEALRKLIPDLVAGGLIGHPFLCPDMIAGGSAKEFLKGAPLDQELFVRSAQLHALCGMMQFSASPWRCLDAEKQQIVRDTVAIRQKFAARFVELAAACGRTGEPMLRNLEYMFPGRGYAGIKDEFMMGDFLLVAPVLEKGAVSRKVVIPPGKWIADDGQVCLGPTEIDVATPLSRLPHFVSMKDNATQQQPANAVDISFDDVAGATPMDVICGARAKLDAARRRQPSARFVLRALPASGSNRVRNAFVNRELRKFCDGRKCFWSAEGGEEAPANPLSVSRVTASNHRWTNGVFGVRWWLSRVAAGRASVARANGDLDLIMLGDSITHFWEEKHAESWTAFTNGLRVANFGCAGDTVTNAIWMAENGALDGLHTKAVSILIGTNDNTSDASDPEEVARRTEKLVGIVRSKQPDAKILLFAIFPRGHASNAAKHAAARKRNEATNMRLAAFAEKVGNLIYVDLASRYLGPDGLVPKRLMADGIHPTPEGYAIWAECLRKELP